MESRLSRQLEEKVTRLLPESTSYGTKPELNWADKSVAGFAKLVPWVGTAASAFLEEKLGNAAVQKLTHFEVGRLFRRSVDQFRLLGEQQRLEDEATSGQLESGEAAEGK